MVTETRIQEILESKGREVHSLPPDASVYQAIEKMAEKRVGALPVVDGEKLVGILSERDYARKVVLKGKASKETRVSEIMTSPVVFITPECTVGEAMDLMTEKRVRHLPVVEQGQMVGIVSIGDLVRSIIQTQADTIGHLHAYISGRYPG